MTFGCGGAGVVEARGIYNRGVRWGERGGLGSTSAEADSAGAVGEVVGAIGLGVAAVLVILVFAVAAGVCITVHWLTMEVLVRRVCSEGEDPPLSRLLLVGMAMLLAAHVVEVTVATAGLWVLIDWPWMELGGLVDTHADLDDALPIDSVFFDTWYFTACTFTTVGYGDLAALGPLRLYAALTALLGFLLITWSASFGFFIMNHAWRGRMARG